MRDFVQLIGQFILALAFMLPALLLIVAGFTPLPINADLIGMWLSAFILGVTWFAMGARE